MLEKVIESNILDFLKEIGLKVWKSPSIGLYDPVKKSFRKRSRHQLNGTCDITGVLPGGKRIDIEVKGPKGTLSPAQRDFIRDMHSELSIAFVSRSVWQTYNQILPFWPEIKTFEYIALKYKQLEESKGN